MNDISTYLNDQYTDQDLWEAFLRGDTDSLVIEL